MISKGPDISATNTFYAQGGIASLGEKDSSEQFINDIMNSGGGINYKKGPWNMWFTALARW